MKMEVENKSILSFAISNSYHVDNRTMQFSYLLNELTSTMQRQFRRHFLYAKDFMLKHLQNHQLSTGYSEIRDLLAHLHTPIIYAYTLCGGILLSLLAVPLIYCIGSCTRKSIDASKYPCCFALEILFYILSAVCLLVGAIGAYQVTLQIQDLLVFFPLIWRNMVQDLLTNIQVFKTQIRYLAKNVKNSSTLIIYEAATVPANLINSLISSKLNVNTSEAIAIFNGSAVRNGLKLNKTGFVSRNGSVAHLLEISIKGLNWKIGIVRDIFGDIYQNLTAYNTQENSLINITQSSEFFESYMIASKNCKYPNWKIAYDDLQTLSKEVLPAAHNSLYFIDHFDSKIKYHFRNEINRIVSAAINLQELSAEVQRNITLGIDRMFPGEIQEAILNATYNIDNYMSALGQKRNNFTRLASGNFWIMMIPSLYAFIVLVLLVSAFISARQTLKKIIANNPQFFPSPKISYTLKFFQVVVLFSISFLWAILILTTIFYCAHLPLSVFCEAVKDQTIFTDYIDKSSVWNNKSWLDDKLHDYLPKHRSSLKVKDLLDKCYQNTSIYTSLNMHQYWNIGQSIRSLNMQVNVSVLHTIAAKIMDETKMPDATMNALIKKLATIEETLDLHFVPAITRSLEKLRANKIEDKIAQSVNNFSEDVLHSDAKAKLILLLKEIQHVSQDQLVHISNFLDLKRQVKKMRTVAHNIATRLSNVSLKMDEAGKTIIPTTLNRISHRIESILKETEITVQENVREVNCYVLPFVYDKAVWSVCYYGLPLISAAWITLGIISISISFSIILSCRISGYINGANSHWCVWRQRMESQRYSSQTARLNGTILFDRFGNIMGSSITIQDKTEEKTS